jgi:hypothetical protein
VDKNLRLDGLGDGSDLVDLKQETVASFLLNGSLDTEGISDGKVVTDDLDATIGGEVSPSLPIVLVEGILNGDDGVLLDVADVEVSELDASEPLRGVGVGVLEVEIVFPILVKLGGGNIESDLDLALITSLLDGLAEELKRLVCTRHVGGESSLITNVDSWFNHTVRKNSNTRVYDWR